MKPNFDSRAEFDRWYSDEWKYPQSVERTNSGSYKLMAAHLAWTAWNEALTRFTAWIPFDSDYQDEAIENGVGSGA